MIVESPMGKVVGRQREERAVRAVLDATGAAVLAGPAGIGKSAVAGWIVVDRPHLAGGGLALLADRRYLALERASRRSLGGDPESVAEVLLDLLQGRTLLVEDLHWTDDDTSVVLGLLTGHAPLLVTTRWEGLHDAHRRFIDRAAVVEVEPLTGGAARRLARVRHPGLDAVAIGDLVDAAEGSPLLIETLASQAELSPSLTSAVAARLAGLARPDGDALGRTALVGRPARPDEVDLTQGRRLGGLVRWRDGLVEVAHSLIGDAVVELLDEPHRRRLHADLADALPGEEAARHELAAGRPQRAHRRARRAAAEADGADRAELLSIAATTATGPLAYRDRCWLDAADALIAAARWIDALDAVDRVEGVGAAERAEAALQRGRAHWLAGDVDPARAALDEGIDVVGAADAALGARLALERAYLAVRHDTSGRVSAARAALDAAERAGQSVLRARATLGAALLYEGRPGWEELLTEVADAAFDADDVELSCTAAYHLSSGLGFTGRLAEGTDLAERQASRARAHGLATWVAHFDATVLINRAMGGGHAEWVRNAARAFLSSRPVFRNRFHAHNALILALDDLGQTEETQRQAERALAEASSAEAELFAAIGSAEVAWVRGDAADLRRTVDVARRHGDAWFGVRVTVEVAACHMALERDEPFEVDLPATVLPQFQAGLHDVSGLLAWQEGDAERAIVELDRAVDAWRSVAITRFEARSALSGALVAERLSRRDAASRRAAAVGIARRGGHSGLLERIGVARTVGLTAREEAVMRLVARGRTTGQVAEELGITAATVDSHVRSARRKLGVASRREAALLVVAAS